LTRHDQSKISVQILLRNTIDDNVKRTYFNLEIHAVILDQGLLGH